MISNRDPSELTESELVAELETLERVLQNRQPSPGQDPEVRYEDLMDEAFDRLMALERLKTVFGGSGPGVGDSGRGVDGAASAE